MKKLFPLFILLVTLFVSTSCSMNTEPTWTVYTDIGTYSEFKQAFGTTLDDGYYVRLEFSSSEWDAIKSSTIDDNKHQWTKAQIKDWFIGRGFGNSEAEKEIAWLTTINHGFIASRTGNTIYFLLK